MPGTRPRPSGGIGSPARWKAGSARRATLQAIKMELRKRLHEPIAKTAAWMYSVLKGYLNYFVVSRHEPRSVCVSNVTLDHFERAAADTRAHGDNDTLPFDIDNRFICDNIADAGANLSA